MKDKFTMYSDDTTNPLVKRCTQCNRDLPATKEFFPCNKDGLYGLRSLCKVCTNENGRKYRLANPEKQKIKAQQDYLKNKSRHDERMRKWYLAHKNEHNQRTREWYKQHPKFNTSFMRQWRAANPEKARAAHQRRRANEAKAEGSYTGDDIKKMQKAQHNKCYYCREKFINGKFHVDHVIPLSRGGSNDPSNLVLACPTCNVQKNAKLPHEWSKGGRLL